MPYNLPPKG